MITLTDVSFAYGADAVLGRINLSLKPGEITCLLGQSGSGKTTLLQVCAGLLQPTSGKISSDFPRPGTAVGYMQQNGGLVPWRRAWENILLGLHLIDAKADRSNAEEALELVGLKGKGDHFPAALSGGQQQRVALARQLVMKPKLLLLDEPLGALDIVLRQELAALIKRIVKSQNIAALVVTHNPDEAIFLADRLCLLAGKPATVTREWVMDSDLAPQTAFHEVVRAMQGEKAHA